MSEASLTILIWTAISIGFIHTLIGPDHYVPFIAIGKARKWSTAKTLSVTGVCGVGHVLSSVIIGAIGIAIGTALGDLEAIESVRGDIASYAFIGFGVLYGIWGLYRAKRSYHHGHSHLPGGKHLDEHNSKTVTFWTLFIIFILGPCEPLIPLLMFPALTGGSAGASPAVAHNWHGVALVTAAFGITTIGTMCAIVYSAIRGLSLVNTAGLERYIHALAGGIIAVSGISIKLFGL
jgi:sulfite exporter TauE/SafE